MEPKQTGMSSLPANHAGNRLVILRVADENDGHGAGTVPQLWITVSLLWITVSLLKRPFLLRQLMLQAALGTLLSHGLCTALAPPDPPNVVVFARGAVSQTPGLAAPA
jgi:hypothetical protein